MDSEHLGTCVLCYTDWLATEQYASNVVKSVPDAIESGALLTCEAQPQEHGLDKYILGLKCHNSLHTSNTILQNLL